jgi:Regulators of stationary/sporulation gene expression
MKSTGVIRKVDGMGRVVIPMELRRNLKIEGADGGEGTPLEIYTEGENIILRKYTPGCEVCGGMKELRTVNNKSICKECAKKIANAWR